MTEDYGCKLCGKHFADEDDYKNHGEQDHPEFNEMYGKEQGDKEYAIYDNQQDAEDQQDERQADEIDQQEDKPVQSHDDWKEDLDSMRDQYSTEDVTDCAICNGEHPTSEHPVTAQEEEEDDQRDMANDLNKPYDLVPKLPEPWEYGGADYKREGDPDGDKAEEEGGADDPLSKVADLAESYRYLSRDKRSILFESVGFGQRDSAVLSGLEWNELTRPVKVEASEAYAKEEDEEKETGEDPEKEENDAYEQFYNLEKNHSSPDYKKKAIECNKCNEKFYNINDKAVHFNEVHATEQEYELPDQCPLCNQLIQEPETLDWHMEQSHGAHVPSTFTQTGISGAMADTDFDSLESYAKEGYGDWDNMGIIKRQELLYAMGEDTKSYELKKFEDLPTDVQTKLVRGGGLESFAKEAKWECLDCDSEFDDAGKHQEETGHHNISKKHESEEYGTPEEEHEEWKKAGDKPISDYHFDLEIVEAVDDSFDGGWACPNCGNKDVIIKRDEAGNPIGRECPECGLGKESRSTEGEGGHQDLDDTTEYPDDDYEWIDGKRVKKKKESTEEEDEGWGVNWGDPEETEKDIYDLGHPEKTEEGDY